MRTVACAGGVQGRVPPSGGPGSLTRKLSVEVGRDGPTSLGFERVDGHVPSLLAQAPKRLVLSCRVMSELTSDEWLEVLAQVSGDASIRWRFHGERGYTLEGRLVGWPPGPPSGWRRTTCIHIEGDRPVPLRVGEYAASSA